MRSFLLVFACCFVFQISSSQEIKLGEKAPDFKLFSLDGTKTTLKDYENKVVVIKMWFKECTPCLQEIPSVNKLVDSYKNREDIVFIAPSPNSKTSLQKFVNKVDFKYDVKSAAYEMLKDYNPLRRYPSHIIIDKKGIISFVYEGTSSHIESILKNAIDKALEI